MNASSAESITSWQPVSRNSSPKNDRQLKVVIVGDGASGKTSLITRYAQDQFGKDYNQTVGLDFFNKHIAFEGDISANLQIWDIGGQNLGGSLLDKYVYGADIVLFVYDISNIRSFDNIQDWLSTINAMVKSDKCHFVLVGNKVDLEHLRVVSKQQHDNFAKENRLGSFLVSAKTGESVSLMFKAVAAHRINIRLSRAEVEKAFPVVKASVNQNAEKSEPPSTTPRKKARSAACSFL